MRSTRIFHSREILPTRDQHGYSLAALPALQEAMRRLAEEKHKPKVEKNNFKCPKCHRVRREGGGEARACGLGVRGFLP